MMMELVQPSCFILEHTAPALLGTMIAGPAIARLCRAPPFPPPAKAMPPTKKARTLDLEQFANIQGVFSEAFVDAIVVTLTLGNTINKWVGVCARCHDRGDTSVGCLKQS
jgi:cytochrome c553